MGDYVWIVVLLLGVAFLFIRTAKQCSSIRLRLIGYALIVMSIFLVVVVILAYLDESSYGYGH